MAFTSSTLKPSTFLGSVGTQAFRTWVYTSTADALAAITAAGYFFGAVSHDYKITHGAVVGGPFQVGETITWNAGADSAVVNEVGANYLRITVSAVPTLDINGAGITGGTSGATATVSARETENADLQIATTDVITCIDSGNAVGERQVTDDFLLTTAVLG